MADSLIRDNAIAAAVLGVGSLPAVLDQWRSRLGFSLLDQRQGPDAGLERLWRLPPGSLKAQALLGSTGQATGNLWLVEFAHPTQAVRANATVTDLCPKSVNLALRDLPRRYAELLAANFNFRSPFVTYPASGLTINEMQWLAADDINVGMLELMGLPFPFNERGYAGFTNFVAVVGDLAAESAFFQDVLEIPFYAQHKLGGPTVERLVGLPAGTSLSMQVLGDAANPLGRLQLIQYEGTTGTDLFPRAVAPARGVLHIVLKTDAMPRLEQKLRSNGVAYRVETEINALLGSGKVISCLSPAGLRADICEIV